MVASGLIMVAAVVAEAGGPAFAGPDPNAPTLSSVTEGNYGAVLTFAAPASIPAGDTVTSYDYQLSTDGGSTVTYEYNTATFAYAEYGNSSATADPYNDPQAPSYCPQASCSFQIRAEYNDGSASDWSSWVAMTLVSAPTVTATNSNYGFALSITPPVLPAGDSITSYDYELSTDGGSTVTYDYNTATFAYAEYGNSSATADPFNDPEAPGYCPQDSCSYRIRADIGLSLTPWSNWVAVIPVAAPTLNSATYSNSGIALSSTPPVLPPGASITSYDYQLSTDGGSTVTYEYNTAEFANPEYGNSSATADPFNDPVAPGYCAPPGTCSYRIRADIGQSQTPWSAWIAVAAGLPAPTMNSATYVDGGVALSYTAPSVPDGDTITSYDYQLSTDDGTTITYTYNTATFAYAEYGNNSPTANPYNDPEAPSYCEPPGTCSYRVRAEIGDGEWASLWSAWVTVEPPLPAPTMNSATYVDDGVALSYTAPTVPGGDTITSYDYQLSTDGGTTVTYGYNTSTFAYAEYGNSSPTANLYNDPEAPSYCEPPGTCSYRIRAEIGDGEWQTPWSAWVTVTPALPAPTMNSATYVDDGVALSYTAPTVPGGDTITSYDYQLSTDGGTTVTYGYNTSTFAYAEYGNSSPTANPYNDPEAPSYCAPPGTCSYRIRAEIGDGEWQTPWSAWVTVAPSLPAPTITGLTPVAQGLSIAFSAPKVPSGLPVSYYNIEISTDGGDTVSTGTNTEDYSYAGNPYGNTYTGSPYIDPGWPSDCSSSGSGCAYRIQAVLGDGEWETPWSTWQTIGLAAELSASPSSGPAPLSTSLTVTTTDPTGEPVTYSLVFGDGSSHTGTISAPYSPVTVLHVYSTPGTYTAAVTVTDTSGISGHTTAVVTATGVVPLQPDPGGSQVVTAGTYATLDGSGSQPASTITGYQWASGDPVGSDQTIGSGATVQHLYSQPGTYTATLTVTGSGGRQASAQTTITVVPAPAAGQGLTVTVSDAHGLVDGAYLAVVTADGTTYPATTNSQGVGVFPTGGADGLPDGTYTVYAYASGDLPATTTATVRVGVGSAMLTLEAGSVGRTSATSTPLTYDQIVALGINPDDPANTNVFQFTINLAFFAGSTSSNVTVSGYLNGDGVFDSDISGGGGGGGGGIDGGGGGGGGGCSGCVSFATDGYQVVGEPFQTAVAGQPPVPSLLWMVIPGQAQWLKEFFDVKTVVSNLAPTGSGFTFTGGRVTLGDLPSGLSLAPTDPAQSTDPTVGDIAAGGSISQDFVLRGDTEGFYGLDATYTGTLAPVGAPLSFPIDTAADAIHVWGGSALTMTVDADDTATAGVPYLVRVGLTDVADVPVYNASVTLLPGGSGYIYQPDQQLSYSTAEIDPGQTFWTDYYRLLPTGNGLTNLNLGQSFVQQTGGNVDVQSTITDHPSTPGLSAAASAQPDGIHLSWTPSTVSGVTGYDIFYTPDRATPFGTTPIATASASATAKVVAHGPSGYYAISTVTASGLSEYHTLVEATAIDTAAAISLSPTTVAGSGDVKVSGSGFKAGKVTFYLDTVSSKKLGTATASAAGTFTKTVKIPSAAGGAHTVIAVSADGSAPSAGLTVTGALKAAPTKAKPGATVTVNLTGFQPDEAVTLTIGTGTNPPTVTLTATAAGTAKATITAPGTKGKTTLTATGNHGTTAHATLTVK